MATATAQTDYAFSGVKMHCILTGKETHGSLCLSENYSPGNSSTPVHLHELEDETICVYEGEMLAVVNGERHTLTAGQAMFMPHNIPHQLKNLSGAPSRYAVLCTPSGFERFVAEAGHSLAEGALPAPPSSADIEAMRELAPRFGIRLLPGFA